MDSKIAELFKQKLKVVNIGAELFADALKQQGVETVHVDWRPPAGGDRKLAQLLDKLR